MAKEDEPTTTEDLLAPSRGEQEVTLPEPREHDEEPTVPGSKPQREAGGRTGGFRKLSQDFENFRTNGVRQHVEAAVAPLNQQIAELKGIISSLRQSPNPETRQEGKETADEAVGIISEMNSLVQEMSAAESPERRAAIVKRHGELQAKLNRVRDEAIAARVSADMEKKYGGQRQQTDNSDPVVKRAYEMIQDEYPELLTGADSEVTKALAKVRAYVDHENIVEERPRTISLYKEAAAHVRAKLGKGEIPEPTRDRRTLQSPGRGQGSGGSPQKNGGKITMPRKLAQAAFQAVPGLTPEKLAELIANQAD